MYQIDNEKFGQFLSDLRKEKSMTQKELADKLFVSDKTVNNSTPRISPTVLTIATYDLLKGDMTYDDA